MLSLEKTFRIIKNAVPAGFAAAETSSVIGDDRLSISPFENPAREWRPRTAARQTSRFAEEVLARAAYFATFPVVD